jgi:peptidoglycan/LPS O-acetylase OafA/YrhL
LAININITLEFFYEETFFPPGWVQTDRQFHRTQRAICETSLHWCVTRATEPRTRLPLKLLERLGRITTAGCTFVPQIDGLRFIAIMAVIGHHVRSAYQDHFCPGLDGYRGDWINDIFLAGNYGVNLFFALSGFVISLPFVRHWLAGGKPVSLRNYFLRRVTRIEPPYFIHLLFLLALCALVLHYQPGEQHYFQNSNWLAVSLRHLLASLVYSNGFIYAAHPYPNVVLWSLEVEIQFYLLAPLFLQVFRIDRAGLRRGLLAGAILLLPFANGGFNQWLHNPYYVWASLLGNLQYFFIGFLVADLWVSGKSLQSSNWFWDLCLVAAGVLAVWGRDAAWLGFALPAMIGVCVISAFKGTLASRVLANPWIMTIGGMCYTIYLYHLLMISLLIRLVAPLTTGISWLDLLICFVVMNLVIVPVSSVFFALFERPFMRRDWLARVLQKFRGPQGPTTSDLSNSTPA